MSHFILGIDPNLDILPDSFKKKAGNSAEDQLTYFCQEALVGAKGLLNSVKFQSAYFEKHGLVGLTVLSKMLQFAKNNGFQVIMDAKRGDIDRTSKAYADAYLKPGGDFEADFLTVSPFLGTTEALEPFVETAINYKKGLFVLVKTSNPGGEEIQSFTNLSSQNLSEYLATRIAEINQKALKNGYQNKIWGPDYGPVGSVVGITKTNTAKNLREIMQNSWFLCPGLGTQGGKMEDIGLFTNGDGLGAWFPMSSSLTKCEENDLLERSFEELVKKRIQELLK